MPKIIKPQTAAQVSRMSRTQAVGNCPGLEIRIPDPANYTVGRSWVLRYTAPDGRRRAMGLGPYPEVSLEEARIRGNQQHALLRDGIDPLEAKTEAKVDAETAALLRTTFEQAALELLDTLKPTWKKKKTRSGEESIQSVSEIQWMGSFNRHLFPILGKLRCSEIQPRHIIECLKPIWWNTPVAADRALQRCKDVLNFAMEKHYCKPGVNAANYHNFKTALPKRGRAKVESHPAMPWVQVPEFMQWLATEERGRIGNYALRFLVMTAARAANVVFLTWDQLHLDGDEPHWLVPDEDMKSGLTHYVPLSTQAVQLLQEVRTDPQVIAHGISGSDFVFPSVYFNYSRNNKGPLTTASLLALTKQFGGQALTTHGFRSTFTDWGAEKFGSNDEKALDLCLAHVEQNKVRRAYLRTELRQRRREILQEWSDYIQPEHIVASYRHDLYEPAIEMLED